jgi:hypothetical protein
MASDQCGNGFSQWYAMDTIAAKALHPPCAADSAVPCHDSRGNSSRARRHGNDSCVRHPPAQQEAPFDFSVPPNPGLWPLGCTLTHVSNSFFYHQIGNLGVIGFSGAYPPAQVVPYLTEACAWAGEQPGLDVLLLAGHWDYAEPDGKLGAVGSTGTVPGAY